MPIRSARALALLGVPLFALAACGDLLQDDAAPPARVLVTAMNETPARTPRVGYPVRLEAFVSDRGGLGVGSVAVRWRVEGQGGTVAPDAERTNGNGFVEAVWTPGTRAGTQSVRVEIDGDTATAVVTLPIAPDTVVGEVVLEAAADSLVEGEATDASITRAADRYGNAYSITGTGAEGLPVTITTLDPEVLTVAGTGASARVTAVAPGTGRVVARVGGRADTVAVVVEKFVPPGSFRVVDAGGYVTCGATPTGAAFCWGDNSTGQLGTGDGAPQRLVPTAVPALAGEVAERFGVGFTHACAVTAAGDAWCWGDNSSGQLGNGDASGAPSAVPLRVEAPAGMRFRELAVGGLHACALTEAGAAWCWGANDGGQAGDGSFANAISPVEVPGVAFASLGLGLTHSCGVSTGGTVHCWGQNFDGQLGDGTQEARGTPVPVSGSLTATSVTGGISHSCALAADGRAFCWGAGISGRLGTGAEDPSLVPAEVRSGAIRFTSIDAGAEHTCAVGTDSEAYCWGTNVFGELGNGVEGGAPSLEPRRVVSPLTPAAGRASAAMQMRPAARPRAARRSAWCRELPAKASAKVRVCR